MSLRVVHLFFIITVIGLFLFLAYYSFSSYQEAHQRIQFLYGVLSLIAAGSALFYFKHIAKTLKNAFPREN